MKKVIILLFVLLSMVAFSAENVLKADFRHRPPEMLVGDSGEINGPLKDILEQAAQRVGYSIKWRIAPFSRSISELKLGNVDIVPRVLMTDERKAYINFLHPIGYQKKDISFLVNKGEENLINTYDDLYKYTIGMKRGTVYFDEFDHDRKIKKMISIDDANLAMMFAAHRFDSMIVLDKKSIEENLKKNHFDNYSYAKYSYPNFIGNYYGMSKRSVKSNIQSELNSAFDDMIKEGLIEKIYAKYNIEPPIQK